MRIITNLKVRFLGLVTAWIRFPLTLIFLVSAVILNAVKIQSGLSESVTELMITMYFGSLLSAVLQLVCERFSGKIRMRMIAFGSAIAVSGIFYLLIRIAGQGTETMVRISMIFFILSIAFLWIPAWGLRIDFNQSFMAAFKGVFSAMFYTGILFLGIVLTIAAFDSLIIRVGGHPYEQSANIIFGLFAPFYYLSLVPCYPDSREETILEREEMLNKATSPARFLEILIAYIIIPVAAVYTIILLLYIVINITGEFWSNNLLEPLLISYSITVIIIYLLAARMTNAVSRYFKLIFPKVLIPVVLFQTLSSVIRAFQEGITYERYYIILFGIFAVIAGVLFSFLPVKKNGVIAPVLIALALVSIVPPCDAFTVSRVNQISRLNDVLTRNRMFQGEEITPNADITVKDRDIIVSSVNYLDRMDGTKKVSWLMSYYNSGNFEKTFGFDRYAVDKDNYRNIYVERKVESPIPITGYDYLIHQNLTSDADNEFSYQFEVSGKSCQMDIEHTPKNTPVILLKSGGQELLRFDTEEIFNRFSVYSSDQTKLNTTELTFTKENETAAITVIFQSISINENDNGVYRYADAYILADIK